MFCPTESVTGKKMQNYLFVGYLNYLQTFQPKCTLTKSVMIKVNVEVKSSKSVCREFRGAQMMLGPTKYWPNCWQQDMKLFVDQFVHSLVHSSMNI